MLPIDINDIKYMIHSDVLMEIYLLFNLLHTLSIKITLYCTLQSSICTKSHSRLVHRASRNPYLPFRCPPSPFPGMVAAPSYCVISYGHYHIALAQTSNWKDICNVTLKSLRFIEVHWNMFYASNSIFGGFDLFFFAKLWINESVIVIQATYAHLNVTNALDLTFELFHGKEQNITWEQKHAAVHILSRSFVQLLMVFI